MLPSAQEGAPLQRNVDLFLGRLAIREGMCTKAQIEECLAIQKMSDPPPALGDILLCKGYLSADQLRDLLGQQQKRVMGCPQCKLSFTVLTLSQGRSARCPRCGVPLAESPPGGPTRTDAEIATQRLKVASPVGGVIPEKTGKEKRMTCVICNHEFDGRPDASRRVRCPSCQGTFTSRT